LHKKYHFAEKPKSAIFSSNSIGEKSYDFLKLPSPFGTWSSSIKNIGAGQLGELPW